MPLRGKVEKILQEGKRACRGELCASKKRKNKEKKKGRMEKSRQKLYWFENTDGLPRRLSPVFRKKDLQGSEKRGGV